MRHDAPRIAHTPLDPRTLGRPVHRLPVFCEELRADVSDLLQMLNRRYSATFQVLGANMTPFDDALGARRWYVWDTARGRMACSMDRELVLGVLAYRFGAPACAHGDEEVPHTATEERMTRSLSQQLLDKLAAQVDPSDAASALAADAGHQGFARGIATARSGAWQVQLQLRDGQSGVTGHLYFMLDAAWTERLLTRLTPASRSSAPVRHEAQSLPKRLQLRLTARLLQQQLALGTLLDLKVGDVLRANLGDTGVYVGDECLFTAVVAEHHGRLCLTAFQDAE
jgi:flagellar motor switch protein FliM